MKQNNSILQVWVRILGIIIAYVIVGGVFYIITAEILGIPFERLGDTVTYTPNQKIIIKSIELITVIVVVFSFRKMVDKKTISSLGFSIKNRLGDLFFGFMVASIMLGVGTVILLFSKEIVVEAFNIDLLLLGKNILVVLLVAFGEEIFVRGYILNNLLDATNKYTALVISSLLFSGLHLLNAHISYLSVINLFLAGILLGSLYIKTRNLWFPISLHFFWNFIQGPVLGFNVSGNETYSIITSNYYESTVLNGGEFGFEGSIICTIVSVVFAAILLGMYPKTKNSIHKVSVIN